MRTRLYEVFSAAHDLGEEDRARFLEEACGLDRNLRASVESLLHASAGSGILVRTSGGRQGPLWQALTEQLVAADEVSEGDRIGLYRLHREIGRGGMAVVYLAERADGEFEQQVALKLLKPGVDTEEVVRRFRQERQILASLNHPAIARILDGGVTDSGRPFYAMELVDGQPIDQYCAEQGLTINQRLQLFVAVARAVQYAHQNLVVHRDLKPSNILVTADAQVKLLDFGIAKLLDAGAAPDGAPATRTDVRLMTPEYASPEQVSGGQVTIASDVYQLGLLLYRLLTGKHPYRLEGCTPVDMERAICDQEPQPPSAAVTAAEKGNSPEHLSNEQTSGVRRRNLGRWRRKLHGDLDTIVLQALRKEPERRYATVAQLQGDIERYLAGKPVLAQKDTVWYRTCKYVQRHAVGVITVLLALLLATGFVSYHTVRLARERDRAQLEADKASQVAAFLKGLFEVSDPDGEFNPDTSARELIDRGADRISGELGDQPEVRAEMMMVLGDIYRKLALYDRAAPLLEESLEIRRERWGDGSEHLVPNLIALGALHAAQGRYGEAEQHYREGLEIVLEAVGPDHLDAVQCYQCLGGICLKTFRFPEAEQYLRQALAVQEREIGDQDVMVSVTLNLLGWVAFSQHEYEEAGQLFRRALEIRERTLGPDHQGVAEILINLARVAFRSSGRLDEAESLYLRALGMVERSLGPEHPRTAMVLYHLAVFRTRQGRLEEAESCYRRAISIRERSSPQHPQLAEQLTSLAGLLTMRGRYGESTELLERALELFQAEFGPDQLPAAWILWGVGTNLGNQGRLDTAERLFRQALMVVERSGGADHPWIGALRLEIASMSLEQARFGDAQEECEAALGALKDSYSDGDPYLEDAHALLGHLYTRVGRYREAETTFRSRLAVFDRLHRQNGLSADQKISRARLSVGLGDLQLQRGDPVSARVSWQTAVSVLEELPAEYQAVLRLDTQVLALLSLGRIDEAVPLLRQLEKTGWRNRALLDRCRQSGVPYESSPQTVQEEVPAIAITRLARTFANGKG